MVQIEDAVDYADAGGEPITVEQIVNIAYDLIHSTSLYNDACKEWRQKSQADKTWLNFKQHFAQAHQDLREDKSTTKQAGYHSAHNMQQFANETVEAIEQLANAAATDKQLFAELINTNRDLTAQLAAKDKQIISLQAQLANKENRPSNIKRPLPNNKN